MEHLKGGLAAALQPQVDTGALAGAVVAVADRKEILALETVGLADIAAGVPMRPDTYFWIASMTKPVAGAAFMILVDEGKAGVDDRADRYIPGFADLQVLRPDGTLTPPARPIVIRDLLTHTSGMRFLNTREANVIDSVPLKDSVAHDLLEPLVAEPGTTYIYSNEGIDTVGRIIEIVSGQSFEGFLQERFFDPLGMADTTFFPNAEQVGRLAKAYRAREDGSGLEEAPVPYLTRPFDGPNRYAAPGGGLFSSARDVVRFCQMLLNGGTFEGRTYLSPESVRRMTTRQTPPGVAENYGFGCSGSLDGKTFGHGGALTTGMNVDHEQVRVFLTQYSGALDPDPGHVFAEAARRLYPGAGEAPAAAIEGTATTRR